MNYQWIINSVSLILFIVSAYFIKKSEACPCPEADVSRRQYILYFSYFEIIYLTLFLVLGKSLGLVLVSFPVLFIIPLFALMGGLVWSIFTIQHVNAMKKCKCPDSIIEEMTYVYAIIELIAWVILMLAFVFIGFTYSIMSGNERKLFTNAFTKEFTKELTNTR